MTAEAPAGPATAGDIATINLESARRYAWSRFWRAPERPGAAESVIEHERLASQFLGDVGVLGRLQTMVEHVEGAAGDPAASALVCAQVAAMGHRFADARLALAEAVGCGAPADAVERLSLSIEQACGTRWRHVLAARRRAALLTPRLETLVPLASLLADLREFDEADRVYRQALEAYDDVSPFALAWACFQLGALWGELVPEPRPALAEQCYRRAIAYVPGYVSARVHLAELLAARGEFAEAEEMLAAVERAGDPEVRWRLADVLDGAGRVEESTAQLAAARSGYDELLAAHPLAFADHGAEFFAGSGGDAERAMRLASENLANRGTLRAFELAYETAVNAHEARRASQIRAAAMQRWAAVPGFKTSPLNGAST